MGDYYRGGGRSSERRPPKRRYREDDEEDNYRGRGRGRYDEGPLSRLRRDTVSIAESALGKIEDTISGIATGFTKDYDKEEVRDGFIPLLESVVTEQPFKIPHIAAIALVVNSQNPEAGKAVLDYFAAALQRHLNAGEISNAKLILRFLACANGMLQDGGVLPLLNQLLNKANSISETNEQGIALSLIYITLITVPYIQVSPGHTNDVDVETLVRVAEEVLNKVSIVQTTRDPFAGNSPPYPEERVKGKNIVDILLIGLKEHFENKPVAEWGGLRCLPKPWEHFLDSLQTASKQNLPEIILPETLTVDNDTVYPDLYFSVFADQPVQTIPPPMDLSSSLFRDAIVDTIDILDCNRLSVSRFLIELDCFYNPKAFIKRATPYDKIKDVVAGGTSSWKPEDIAVDAIFSQLFKLPLPRHKLIYYHAVLTELCKLAPAAIAPSLGRAIRFMYRNLEIMDTELIYRFTDWFSHHLSNFGFTWKWGEWSEHLNFPDVHPKRAFILGALEKEIRLSFATRIKGTLPDAFKELIPEEREKEQPVFKYDIPDEPLAAEGKELLHALVERKDDTVIDEIMTRITSTSSERGLTSTPEEECKFARDVYITCICHIGAKSLSHVLSCIERCKDKLLALGSESDDAGRQIVGSVMAYWKDQPGVGGNVVDKLLNYSIVKPLSIVEWVLYDAGAQSLSQVHAWEMVATTTRKVNGRIRQIVAAKAAIEASGSEEQVTVYTDTMASAVAEKQEILDRMLLRLGEMADTEELEHVDVESIAWVQWWARGWMLSFRRLFEVDLDGNLPAVPEIDMEKVREAKERIEMDKKEMEDDDSKMEEAQMDGDQPLFTEGDMDTAEA